MKTVPTDFTLALIGVVSGGGLTALIKLLIDQSQTKRAARDKAIDDRIVAWQEISKKTESRLEQLEKKLESYDRDFRSMERYILSLERIILKEVPAAELPARPALEREVERS